MSRFVGIGIAAAIVASCGPGDEAIEWRIRFSAVTPRPDTVLEVELRHDCSPGAEVLDSWVMPLPEAPQALETDLERVGIAVTAVDDGCRAYARGCVVAGLATGAADSVVVTLRSIVEDLRCGAPSCEPGTCASSRTEGDAGASSDGAVDAGACVPADCPGNRCLDGECAYHPSCDVLRASTPSAPSGVYALDPDRDGPLEPFDAWCEMEGERGWTLLMKVDGTTESFHYDDARWTDDTLLAEDALGLDGTEAKLRGFGSIAFTQMRVGLEREGETRWATLDVAAESLQSLFSGEHRETALGREAWESLLDGTLLQANCNREGINVARDSGEGEIRLGIIANGEDDCRTPDSAIGLGIRGPRESCENVFDVAVGDVRSCSDAFRNEPAFGYVLVR